MTMAFNWVGGVSRALLISYKLMAHIWTASFRRISFFNEAEDITPILGNLDFASDVSGFGATSGGFGATSDDFNATSGGFGAMSGGLSATSGSFGATPGGFGVMPGAVSEFW